MGALSFEKYEGTGNDFVLVDEATAAGLSTTEIARVCDRHFGIGADGVIIVAPPVDVSHVARMIVRNADGSRPEMCGNGLRCVALYVARTLGRGAAGATGVYETDAGLRACEVSLDGDRGTVSVAMGRANLQGERELEVLGQRIRVGLVDMGNPHAVVLEPPPADRMEAWGRAIEKDASFPQGVNVGFVQQRAGGEGFDLVVWERGVGFTLACGTGACAAAAYVTQRGLVAPGSAVSVKLPGGVLSIEVETGSGLTTMRGPARRVFSGTLPC